MTANLQPLDEPGRPSPDPAGQTPVDPGVDRAGEALREMALDRLRKKADFRMHVLVYVLFNGMFLLVWAMTGRHFFWPVFPMGIWGIGLVAHAVDTFGHSVPTEDDILDEMDRLRRR